MKLSAKILFDAFHPEGLVEEMIGDDREIERFSPSDSANSGDLVFVDRSEFFADLAQLSSLVVVLPREFVPLASSLSEATLLVATDVPLAHALMRQKYDDRNIRTEGWGRIHESSVIHPSANVSSTAHVGPGAVISAGVEIGDEAIIMANAVVESNAVIGSNTVIHPNVVIGVHCRIGNGVIIQSGTTIGAEGYGFSQDQNRTSHRIPQTGIVVIEDDVVVGANCCIDRATYRETRIKRGTKIDNLCHIAHNVEIGEDCLLTAGLVVAGSTTIGDRVITSGQTGILDHLTIADDTVLLHRAGVAKSIEEGGAYAGHPLQPLKTYLKNSAIQQKLSELRKRMIDVEKSVKR